MKKKLLSILLTVILGSSVLAGCGSESSNSGSKNEKPYNVNFMYVVPSTFSDQSKVEKAISDLALKQINMKVHLIPVSWGSYQQQLQLMLSSNEGLDTFPLLANLMSGYKANGYLVDMSKLIDKYGVNIKKQIGEKEAKICNVNGFIYGVTTLREWANPAGFVLRKDIVDKCGIDTSKIKTFDDMTNVFATVKAKYPNMEVFTGTKGSDISNIGAFYDSLADNLGVLMDDGQTNKVSNLYETDEYASRVKLMRKWYQAGYVKKDLATSNDSGETLMRAGNAFSFYSLIKPNSKAEKDSQTGFETVIVPMTAPIKMTTSIGSFSYAIANNSKDPEKAMKFLDWAYGSSEFNNLLNWGIEGEHYVYKDKKNNIIDFPKDVNIKNDKYHVDFGYAIPNQFIASIWTGNEPTLWDTMRKFNNDAKVSKAYGFYFDATSVTNEISALSSIQTKYVNALGSGSVDPDSTIAKFNKELKAAGLDKVIDAKQKQLNEWFKKNNK